MSFFKNKKILITGHTGFKGSWLTQWLLMKDASIVGYALKPNTKPNLFEILKLKGQIKNYFADILDYKKLDQVIKAEKPEIIFHLAAQPLVRESYINPKKTFETNIVGTVNLLEVARQADFVKAIVNVTTDKVYKDQDLAYKETDELGGDDPYSASKACSELVSQSYRQSFLPDKIATARAGNVIGGGDWSKDRIISDFIEAIVDSKTIFLRNPHATRPWQHVLEPLRGYLMLAQKLYERPKDFSSAWNFGPNKESEVNVETLTKSLIQAWGQGYYEIDSEDKHPKESNYLRLNTDKAKTYLGFKPVLNFDKTIQMTVDWYKNFYQKEDIVLFTKKQIENYEKEISW